MPVNNGFPEAPMPSLSPPPLVRRSAVASLFPNSPILHNGRPFVLVSDSDSDDLPGLLSDPEVVHSDASTVIYESCGESVGPVSHQAVRGSPVAGSPISPIVLVRSHSPWARFRPRIAAHNQDVANNRAGGAGCFDEAKAAADELVARAADDAHVNEAKLLRRTERKRRKTDRAAARRAASDRIAVARAAAAIRDRAAAHRARCDAAVQAARARRDAAVLAARDRPAGGADGSPVRHVVRHWDDWQSFELWVGTTAGRPLKIGGRFGPLAMEWVFYDAAPVEIQQGALRSYGFRCRRDVYESFGREYHQPLFCCNNCSCIYVDGVAAAAEVFNCACVEYHTICGRCAARPAALLACEDCNFPLYQ
jgi:hypothetical protein